MDFDDYFYKMSATIAKSTIKILNFALEKIKCGLYYILYYLYIIISVCFFVAFFIFADLLYTKYFFVEILLFVAGIIFTYIQFKINPDLLIDETEQSQAEIEEKRKSRAAAVLDWHITYEWAVLLGKDKK